MKRKRRGPRPTKVNKYEDLAKQQRLALFKLSSCKSKKRYTTEAEAKQDAGKQRVYQCGFCRGWHRTSRPKLPPRGKRRS